MTLDYSVLSKAFEHLCNGAQAVDITEVDGRVRIESIDPVLTVAEVSRMLQYSPAKVRYLERIGKLHAAKGKGTGGSLRFRKSRIMADLARMENL